MLVGPRIFFSQSKCRDARRVALRVVTSFRRFYKNCSAGKVSHSTITAHGDRELSDFPQNERIARGQLLILFHKTCNVNRNDKAVS